MEAFELDLEFVDDPDLRAVLEDYYLQTRHAARAGSYLGVIVGCGSIVEGLLTWALLKREDEAAKSSRAPKDKQDQVVPVRHWLLTHLIDVSAELGVIGETAKKAAWALKDFRNFIHPYNLLQQSARPSPWLASSSLASLAEICRSLQGRLPK